MGGAAHRRDLGAQRGAVRVGERLPAQLFEHERLLAPERLVGVAKRAQAGRGARSKDTRRDVANGEKERKGEIGGQVKRHKER